MSAAAVKVLDEAATNLLMAGDARGARALASLVLSALRLVEVHPGGAAGAAGDLLEAAQIIEDTIERETAPWVPVIDLDEARARLRREP